MGRKTNDQLLTFGDYSGKEVFVVSRSRTGERDENVTFVGPEIVGIVRSLKADEGTGIWLVGGSQLVRLFIAEHLIDEIIISVHPIILGSGIPLFIIHDDETQLVFAGCKSFNSGLVQLKYNVKKQGE